jgi:prevent-host-death family protein
MTEVEVVLLVLYSAHHREEAGMTRIVSVDEAQEKLQDLLAQALAGNEVIITEHGNPVARLVPVPVSQPKKKRVPGLNRGTIWTSEDFDQPLPDEFWLVKE